MLRRLPTSGHGMDGLRTAVSALGQLDGQISTTLDPGTLLAQGLRLTAQVPTLLAAWGAAAGGPGAGGARPRARPRRQSAVYAARHKA